MGKQSFIRGALILMIANAISKILGAVLKIPLTYILREEGMAVYNTAFNVYVMFLSFIISGLPFGISKLVSEYASVKNERMIHISVRISSYLLLILGAAGTVILFFGAEFFALAMREERAVFAIRAIAPSVFLVAAGTACKSYFQGVSDMTPTAISQVVEAVIKLVCGFYLAKRFIEMGTDIAAGGAIAGVSVGELVATLILILMYAAVKGKKHKCTRAERNEVMSRLMAVALPMLVSSVISSMLAVVDTSMIRGRLMDYGHSADEARRIFGAYTGYALTVLHLPVGIFATLGVSILPVIAGSIAAGKYERTRAASERALKLIIITSLPCAAAVYFLGADILETLFKNSSSAAMLTLASPCIVFLCVSQILSAIMQSAGRIMTSFANSAAGMVLKLVLSYVLIGKYGIYGAIISADISYFAVMLLDLYTTRKIIGLKYRLGEILIKPAVSTAAMAAVLYLTYPVIAAHTDNHMLICALSGVWGMGVYVLTLLLVGGIRKTDIEKQRI